MPPRNRPKFPGFYKSHGTLRIRVQTPGGQGLYRVEPTLNLEPLGGANVDVQGLWNTIYNAEANYANLDADLLPFVQAGVDAHAVFDANMTSARINNPASLYLGLPHATDLAPRLDRFRDALLEGDVDALDVVKAELREVYVRLITSPLFRSVSLMPRDGPEGGRRVEVANLACTRYLDTMTALILRRAGHLDVDIPVYSVRRVDLQMERALEAAVPQWRLQLRWTEWPPGGAPARAPPTPDAAAGILFDVAGRGDGSYPCKVARWSGHMMLSIYPEAAAAAAGKGFPNDPPPSVRGRGGRRVILAVGRAVGPVSDLDALTAATHKVGVAGAARGDMHHRDSVLYRFVGIVTAAEAAEEAYAHYSARVAAWEARLPAPTAAQVDAFARFETARDLLAATHGEWTRDEGGAVVANPAFLLQLKAARAYWRVQARRGPGGAPWAAPGGVAEAVPIPLPPAPRAGALPDLNLVLGGVL